MSADFTLPPLKVFISYAHEDETCCKKLKNHLTSLVRSLVIQLWDKSKISPGEDEEAEIEKNLMESEIILLLVSSNFIASDSCTKEACTAMNRHKKGEVVVIPIIVRSVDWKSSCFGKLKPLPENKEPVSQWKDSDEAWKNVVEGIEKAAEKLQQRKELQRKEILEQVDKQPDCVIDPAHDLNSHNIELILEAQDELVMDLILLALGETNFPIKPDKIKSIAQFEQKMAQIRKFLERIIDPLDQQFTLATAPAPAPIVHHSVYLPDSVMLSTTTALFKTITENDDRTKKGISALENCLTQKLFQNEKMVLNKIKKEINDHKLYIAWGLYLLAKHSDSDNNYLQTLSSHLVASTARSAKDFARKPPQICQCLLVKVNPCVIGSSKSNIKVVAWVQLQQNQEFTPLYYGDEVKNNRLAEELNNIMNKLGDCYQVDEKLVIEIFLPKNLCLKKISDWKYRDSSKKKRKNTEAITIWQEWRLIFRSYERAYNEKLYNLSRSKWEEKWQQVKDHIENGLSLSGEQFLSLNDGHFNISEKKLCVFVPHIENEQCFSEILYRVNMSGSPILVVLRENVLPHGENIPQHLCFDVNNLKAIPEKVHALRNEIDAGDPFHLGHHLILFWEDPDKIPQEDLAQTP
jgi:hypothetical protein